MMHIIYHENQEQAARYDDDEKPHFVTETKDFNIICIDTALTYTKQRNNDLFIGTEYIMIKKCCIAACRKRQCLIRISCNSIFFHTGTDKEERVL